MAVEPRKLPKVSKRILERVRRGMPGVRAGEAEGVPERTWRYWQGLMRAGEPAYVEFFDAVAQAEALSEADDVEITARAAQPAMRKLACPDCARPIDVDVNALEGAHRITTEAAKVAFERLARRFPGRWSPSSRVSIEAEHEEFVELALEVLEPEQAQKLFRAWMERKGAVTPPPEPKGDEGTPTQH